MALLALAMIGGGPLSAQTEVSDWKIESQEWTRQLAAGASVGMSNPWGDLRVRAADGEQLRLRAEVQRHADDPREPVFDLQPSAEGLRIEVGFAVVELPDPVPAEWQARRIDLGLLLPAGAELAAEVDSGLLEVRGVSAHARLSSDSGRISYRGKGSLEARSQTGSVAAQLRSSDRSRPVTIVTSTGDIRVELLEGAKATVELQTSGYVTTDYSLDIDRQPGSRSKQARAEVGGGGPEISLTSDKGAIQLVSLIVPEGAEADD